MSKLVLILRLISCYYNAVQMILKKTLLLRKLQDILKLAEEASDGKTWHHKHDIIKRCHHRQKSANESVPSLKSVGPSSLCKTVKTSKVSDKQLNAMQENPTDSTKKLKLSNPHKIILGHLNINSLRNKFE